MITNTKNNFDKTFNCFIDNLNKKVVDTDSLKKAKESKNNVLRIILLLLVLLVNLSFIQSIENIKTKHDEINDFKNSSLSISHESMNKYTQESLDLKLLNEEAEQTTQIYFFLNFCISLLAFYFEKKCNINDSVFLVFLFSPIFFSAVCAMAVFNSYNVDSSYIKMAYQFNIYSPVALISVIAVLAVVFESDFSNKIKYYRDRTLKTKESELHYLDLDIKVTRDLILNTEHSLDWFTYLNNRALKEEDAFVLSKIDTFLKILNKRFSEEKEQKELFNKNKQLINEIETNKKRLKKETLVL